MEGHLVRHGVNAGAISVVSQNGDEANTILNHAANVGTDLIVMGGYGHNRFREFVLGGVTRELLKSMTAPVLMSH
jgi:nucleotide-binding universal stress UspA family protein